MSSPPVDFDHHRVRHLLQLLRRRTPEEVMIGAMLFAPAFTPEMREALRLLHLERSRMDNPALPHSTPSPQTGCRPEGALAGDVSTAAPCAALFGAQERFRDTPQS